MNKKILQWHPGFYAVIQIELQDEKNLEFLIEYELSRKPMRIDTLIIKKTGSQPVQKNIGRMFRTYNLIEYKSPEDYLSINDFYKVYGYACFFQADTERVREIEMNEITITFVCNHFPREMIRCLKEERGVEIEKVSPGIYYLKNEFIPIQIILSHELPPAENRWLNNLRDDLQADEQTNLLLKDYQEHKDSKIYQAAMDIIVRANEKAIEEARDVCEALKELFADEIKEQVEAQVKEQVEAQVKEQVEAQVKEQVEAQVKEQVEAKMEEHDNRMALLFQKMLADGRMDDLKRASEEKEYREKMYLEYNL